MKGKQLRHSVFLYFLLIYSPERNELKAVLIKSSLIEENHYIKCRRICQGAMYVIQDFAVKHFSWDPNASVDDLKARHR